MAALRPMSDWLSTACSTMGLLRASTNIIFNLSPVWQQENKPAGANGKKKKFYRTAKGGVTRKTSYKSQLVGLENDTFEVGASSDPAKFSKLLKNIENFICWITHKIPNNMVKTIQQKERATLNYLIKPNKGDAHCLVEGGNPDFNAFDMVVFAWKEDEKSMKSRMNKCKDNQSNARPLIYDQCSPELKNKLEGTDRFNNAK